MKEIKNESGIALIWSLVTIAVLLLITSSMANLIVKESKMSTGIDGSVKAYAAAQSGIEHGTFLIENATSCDAVQTNLSGNVAGEGSPNYTGTITKDCTLKTYTIQSTGTQGSMARKLEKTLNFSNNQPSVNLYDANPGFDSTAAIGKHPTSAIHTDFSEIDLATTSFTQIFKLDMANNWEGSTNNRIMIGLMDTSDSGDFDATGTYGFSSGVYNPNSDVLFIEFLKDTTTSSSNCNGGTATYTNAVKLWMKGKCSVVDDFSLTNNTSYIIKLSYKKGSTLKAEIYEGTNIAGDCKKVLYVEPSYAITNDIWGFYDMDKVFFYDFASGNNSVYDAINKKIQIGTLSIKGYVDYMGLQK